MDSELFRTYKAIMNQTIAYMMSNKSRMFVFVKQVDQWKMEKIGRMKAGESVHELIHLLRGVANY